MRRLRRLRVEDVWNRLSHSKLSAVAACPLRGVLEFVLDIPGPLHPYTALGQSVHYAFFLFFRKHPKTLRYPFLERSAFQGFWKGFWWGAIPTKDRPSRHGFGSRGEDPRDVAWEFEGQPGVLFGTGLKALNLFFENFDSIRHDGRVHLVEKRFVIRWHHLTLSGVIDRIDLEDDGAVITDYKSKRYPDHLLETGTQMTLYQLAYEVCFRQRLPGKPPLKAIRIYDYRSGTTQNAPLRSPYEFGMLLKHLTETSLYLRGVFTGQAPSVEQMLEFRIYDPNDIFRGDVSPNLPRGEHCNYCSYYQQCRAWERRELPIARLMLREKIERHELSINPNQVRIPFEALPLVRSGMQSIDIIWQQAQRRALHNPASLFTPYPV